MKFRRAVQRYGRTPQPVTPYQRAAQMWDERIGSARAQARSWRLMAFGGLLLSTGLSGGLVWKSMQSRVTPYVVAVDRLGEARAIAPADREYQPTDPQIAWFLAHFIACVRSISLDPVLMRENWLSAYAFATARGARFLGNYARNSNPFGDIGSRTVSVEVTSVVRASEHSFELKWIERAYDRGNPAGISHWTAILSVVQSPPASADVLRHNPLGLYVDAIDWSRELDTSQSDSSAPSSPPLTPQGRSSSTLPPPDLGAADSAVQPSLSTRSKS